MYVIERHYGNDGYAFWFKLLELLGKTEGHYYDCNNIDNWEFLQAKTMFLEVKCNEILDKLAILGAIDKFLWEEKRIIWSDNFVSNISDAYKNRKRPVPKKPFLMIETPTTPNTALVSTGKTAVSTAEKPQSIVEESRVDKKILNNNSAREEIKPVDSVDNVDNFLGMDLPEDLYPLGNAAEETAATLADSDQSLESSGDDFMSFWNAYPKRSGMPKAMEAWKLLMAQGINPEYLVLAAKKYALRVISDKTEVKFIKMPHNFLLERTFYEYLPRNLPDCPRCKGAGYYDNDDGVAICDCRKVLLPNFTAAV